MKTISRSPGNILLQAKSSNIQNKIINFFYADPIQTSAPVLVPSERTLINFLYNKASKAPRTLIPVR